MLAHFSFLGFPLLSGFPVYMILWEQISALGIAFIAWSVLGIAGFLVGAMRSLANIFKGAEELTWSSGERETAFQKALILIGMAAIFVVGIFPQWFLPLLISFPTGFASPGP